MAGDGYHRDVSNPQFQPQPSGPPQWPPAPTKSARSPLLLVIASLAIALIALGVAIGGWFRPAPATKSAPGPTYTSQQVSDSKSKVCAAFSKVDNAVRAATSRDKGQDYATQLASAVNVRQAMATGSQYLSTTVNQEPATPSDLAASIHDLANAYQLLTVQLLADAPESEKNPTVQSGDDATNKIENLCK
jgi:hypothetical protein